MNKASGGLRAAVLTAALGLSFLFSAGAFADEAARDGGQTIVFVNGSRFSVTLRKGEYGGPVACVLSPRGRVVYHTTGSEREIIFYPVYEAPLTASVTLKGQIDKSVFLQRAFSDKAGEMRVPPPEHFENNAVYLVFENKSANGVSVLARGGNSFLTLFPGRADTINAGETGVFESNARTLGTPSVYHPRVAFPAIVYRPGYRYVYTFDGTMVTLVDARPLHTIGQPLDAALVFEGAIPADEREALREALNKGLAAADAPFRVEGISNTGNEGGDYLSYTFTVALTMEKQTVTFPTRREMYSGEVTVTLTRESGGNSGLIAEHKTAVTEFNEAGVYRAVRQFLTGDRELHQAIAGVVDSG
jgi:hypothetical protein